MAKSLKEYLSDRRKRLPKPIAVDEAAAQIERLHREQGGATCNLYFGDMSGQALFAVSLYPEEGTAVTIAGRFAPADLLRVFINVNRDLLADPRLCVGTWYQEDEDITFVDIVVVLPDRDEALALGKKYNQIAIYDLAQKEALDSGGTGEWMLPEIPPNQRLPGLERG